MGSVGGEVWSGKVVRVHNRRRIRSQSTATRRSRSELLNGLESSCDVANIHGRIAWEMEEIESLSKDIVEIDIRERAIPNDFG